MEQARTTALQGRIAEEAMAVISLTSSDADVTDYEQVIEITGRANGIPRAITEEYLRRIDAAREETFRVERGETVTDSVISGVVQINWPPRKIIETVELLFESSVQLEQREYRAALFNMARMLMGMHNLMDLLPDGPQAGTVS